MARRSSGALLGLAAGAAAVGGIAYLVTRPKAASNPQPQAPTVASALATAKASANVPAGWIDTGWWRVHADTDVAYEEQIAGQANLSSSTAQQAVEQALTRELEAGGFSSTRLAVQDPTVEGRWTFLSYWGGGRRPVPSFAHLRIDGVDPIVEPPVPTLSTSTPRLDSGLTTDEAFAVGVALARDQDPSRLEGFATTMDGDFPVSAAFLHAKSRLETTSREQTPAVVSAASARVSGYAQHVTRMLRRMVGGKRVTFGQAESPTSKTLEALRQAVKDLGGETQQAWELYGPTIEALGTAIGAGVTAPETWMAETAAALADDLESRPENLYSDAARQIKAAAPLLSVVPGVGEGVAAALTGAMAVALGEPISDAALEAAAAAVPGGPAAQAAFRSALVMGQGVTNGRPAPAIYLAMARAALPDVQSAAAFDAGVSLGRAVALQDEDVKALLPLARGDSLADKQVSLSDAILEARSSSPEKEPRDVLVERLGRAFDGLRVNDPRDLALDAYGMVVSDILANPSLMMSFPGQLAAKEGVDPVVAWAAIASVKDAGAGVLLVDPVVANRVRSGVSLKPSAVQVGAAYLRGLTREGKPASFAVGSILDPLGSWADPVTKPVDDLTSSIAQTVGDILSKIPGESDVAKTVTALVNGPLKDFANTAVGKVFLTALASSVYGALAVYKGVGAYVVNALATSAFAIPGMAKGDDFDHAWIEGVVDRVKKTIEMLGGEAAGAAADQVAQAIPPDIVEKAQGAVDEVVQAVQSLKDQFPDGNVNIDVGAIADQLGVSDYSAAIAKAIVTRVAPCDPFPDCLSSIYDPVTGAPYLGRETSGTGVTDTSAVQAYGPKLGSLVQSRLAQGAMASRSMVAASAIQFQAATLKPTINQVAAKSNVSPVFQQMASAALSGDPNAQEEAAQLAKAKRALDRQNWVEWYKRAVAANLI